MKLAEEQWRSGIKKEVVMANEVYEGDFNERGERHGEGIQWP